MSCSTGTSASSNVTLRQVIWHMKDCVFVLCMISLYDMYTQAPAPVVMWHMRRVMWHVKVRCPPRCRRLFTRASLRYGNTLQQNATRCNTLQHTATHCNTLRRWGMAQQHTATKCDTLQHTATHCNTLQHTATHCNTLRRTVDIRWLMCILQHSATHCNTPQHTATHGNTLQQTATHRYCNAQMVYVDLCTYMQSRPNVISSKQRPCICQHRKWCACMFVCMCVCARVCVRMYT